MRATSIDTVAARSKLVKLGHRRLGKYATLLPKALIDDAPEVIHDLRVASRRLQQLLRALGPAAHAKVLKKTTAVLRHVRQALGPCRDLDVNLALIDAKREQGAAGSVQRAWQFMADEVASQRPALLARARHEIASQDLYKLIHRVQRLLAAQQSDFDALEPIAATMVKSMEVWREAFESARQQPEVAALHRLRIAGKKLRYRAEILTALGQAKVKPLVKTLEAMQAALGDWHDRSVLLHQVADFIGRPEFLAEHPDMARILLAEMEKERLRSAADAASILRLADKVPEAWTNWKASTVTTE